MLQEELEAMIGHTVTVDQYNLVNRVYMNHPADLSKQSIANLWELGGFEIFKELTPAADQMRTLETHINTLKRQLRNAEEEF